MNKAKIEKTIKHIDKVLKSHKSVLDIKDREELIVAREEIRNSKTKFDLIKPLQIIVKILGVAGKFYDKIT
ncbi:MAG TPA: hypothetical protein VK154_06600 [Chitinophagales bacterium]|nr:hypothetical protein [Chitinophagales bacterium]